MTNKSSPVTVVQSNQKCLPSKLSLCEAMCPLCFQLGKRAYFHLGRSAFVNVNHVGLLNKSIWL